jgi:hypothetical protein
MSTPCDERFTPSTWYCLANLDNSFGTLESTSVQYILFYDIQHAGTNWEMGQTRDPGVCESVVLDHSGCI